jgi:hypothetical protein
MAGETTTNPSYPILVGGKNPFADAEPYYYGKVASTTDYFKPIGEDTNDENTNIQPALPEKNNGYSEIKSIDGFRISGEPMQYIEKGTFPLPKLLASTATDKTEAQTYELIITYNENDPYNISEIKFGSNTSNT